MRRIASLIPFVAAALLSAAPAGPKEAVDELLAADRAFAAAAASRSVIDGLSPMFADDVIVPSGGKLLKGKKAVLGALLEKAENSTAHATWAPVRGGISADGQQGFTFGFMTITRQDGPSTSVKYMTYWAKTPAGWRAVAYKRAPAPAGAPDTSMMPPSLPNAMVAPLATPASATQSLMAAEQAFSDEAQKIGLGPAFLKFGAPDAANMGGPASASYVVGNKAISELVGAGQPAGGSTLNWSCETCIVSSSGDLGVSIGFIRANAAPAAAGAAPQAFAFFTIWKKVAGEWKYVAE